MLKVDQLETSGPEAWPGAVFPEFSSCFRYPTLGAEGDRCTQKQKQKFTLKSQRTWKKQDELARQKTPKHLKAALIKKCFNEHTWKKWKRQGKAVQMTADFLPQTMETRKKVAQYFWSVEWRKYWPRKWWKTKRLYQQQIYLIIMAKGSSLNRKEKNKRKHIGISWSKKE